MPTPASSLSFTSVTARLRTAGCVFAEEEARLLLNAAPDPASLERMLLDRADGLPLEQVLGRAEFHGLSIAVAPGVFVPRRRSEFLVDVALALTPPGATVVDLCCGTGALGAALAAAADGPVDLHAADLAPAAVACARRNTAAFGGRVHEGDLCAALPSALRGRVDLLLANVPYVPTGEIALLPAEARLHEARLALDGGTDGLDVLRRVAAEAGSWLAPGGSLLFETGEHQAAEASALVTAAGLAGRVDTSASHGATVVVGTAGKPLVTGGMSGQDG
ncbi:putative protein N(5)-glutamine methyltransferase [Streptomyces sp. TR06-5]|uniref:putative protein N(5)-glutamine methyltransferase n=1 Tax=unclassified Streptomyces TaxID=2593676 RepID=UPI0039A1DDD2